MGSELCIRDRPARGPSRTFLGPLAGASGYGCGSCPFAQNAESSENSLLQNAEIARLFEELADLLEIQGANPFRLRAYRNAGRTIEGLTEPIAVLAEEGEKALTELQGIGKAVA